MVKMWILISGLASRSGMKMSYTEKLIYTLNQHYRWVDKVLTKKGIWRSELSSRSGMKMSYTEKLIYPLDT